MYLRCWFQVNNICLAWLETGERDLNNYHKHTETTYIFGFTYFHQGSRSLLGRFNLFQRGEMPVNIFVHRTNLMGGAPGESTWADHGGSMGPHGWEANLGLPHLQLKLSISIN